MSSLERWFGVSGTGNLTRNQAEIVAEMADELAKDYLESDWWIAMVEALDTLGWEV